MTTPNAELLEEFYAGPYGPYFVLSLREHWTRNTQKSVDFDKQVGIDNIWPKLCYEHKLTGEESTVERCDNFRAALENTSREDLLKQIFELGYIEEAMNAKRILEMLDNEPQDRKP